MRNHLHNDAHWNHIFEKFMALNINTDIKKGEAKLADIQIFRLREIYENQTFGVFICVNLELCRKKHLPILVNFSKDGGEYSVFLLSS